MLAIVGRDEHLSRSRGVRLEQAGDLEVPGLRRVLPQRLPLGVTRLGKRWQTSQEPLHPPDVIFANGEHDIVDLDGQQPTVLTQVLNRPPCGSGMEPVVARVDVGAAGKEQVGDLAPSVHSRVVKSCRAFVIFYVGRRCIRSEELADSLRVARCDG
jgi:hypothetical protein